MKNFSLKFAVGFLALITGIFVVWSSGIFHMPPVAPEKNEKLIASPPENQQADKVIIRFKGFELYKDWVAKFEIANYTAKPVTYIGFNSKTEFDFCTLLAQRDETNEITGVKSRASGSKIRDNCQMSKAVILQKIEPNEKVIFSVSKHEIQNLVDLREKYKNAQIGFEFFVDEEKRREIFWTEDITFPADKN